MPTDIHALARSIMCVGFDGVDATDATLDALRVFGPGAILLFARNVGTAEQLRDLIVALRACGDIAPLIAVDQEGGRVARITDERLVAQLPSAMALGATADAGLCERLGTLLGRDLAGLGVSVDFAPCADLALDARNTVIGTRSFGEAPHAVAHLSAAFARGLETGGVAAAIKHFPGHGDTHLDSHTELPHIVVDAATLRTRDLVPFANAVAGEAASIVMTAHVVVDALDPHVPATLSYPILTGLLRRELGFTGVIATDCLEMDAIAARTGTAAAACAALAAGADMLVVSRHLDRAHEAVEAIVAAIADGTLSRARLDDAADRVRRLRERFATPVPFAGAVDAGAPLEAAQRAVTVVRGSARLRDGKPVTVLSFEGTIVEGAAGVRTQTPSLSAALRRRRWKSELMRVPLEPDEDDLDLLLSHLPSLGDRNFAIVIRRAHLLPRQRAAVDRILAVVPDALVVSAREPFDAVLFPAARNLVCTYGDEVLSLEGCADVMSGHARGRGTLPVTLDRDRIVR